MTKDEALRLALEAFKSITWVNSYNDGDYLTCNFKSVEQAITAIKAALEAKDEPVAWPAGLIERIKAAEQRVQDGHAPRRIPADPSDVDLVLAEVRYLLDGKQPPFWVNTTPPQRKPLTDEEIFKALGGIDCTRPMLITRAIESAHGITGDNNG